MPTPAIIFLALGVAAILAGVWLASRDGRLDAADTRPDVGLSIMERVDDRADSIGTWRPARRLDDGTMETPGQVEPDDAPAEDPHAWAVSCGRFAELIAAKQILIEARQGVGRHRRCYTGEWPLLAELATAGERSAA